MSMSTNGPDRSGGSNTHERFWMSFGANSPPAFDGISVLEIGCGAGRRCIEVALMGAERVVGIDPLATSIADANDLEHQSPALKDRVEFHCCCIAEVANEGFRRDPFREHVRAHHGPGNVLAEIRKKLKAGGEPTSALARSIIALTATIAGFVPRSLSGADSLGDTSSFRSGCS